ncbi:MAG: MFS transporter [Acidimicrobiales bacterium]|nr:MFS transporter [Acidimicrobiales bacterium]
MIRHLYPDRAERARSLGIWAAVSSLGLALGPLVGGLLVFGWSWRAIFWANVFFGALAFISAAIVLPESSDPVRGRFDLPGMFLGALALGSLTFAIILGETSGYRTWWIDLLFLSALVMAAAFVLAELRATNPVLNVRYFKKPAFPGLLR